MSSPARFLANKCSLCKLAVSFGLPHRLNLKWLPEKSIIKFVIFALIIRSEFRHLVEPWRCYKILILAEGLKNVIWSIFKGTAASKVKHVTRSISCLKLLQRLHAQSC